jgi:hypothetical protein
VQVSPFSSFVLDKYIAPRVSAFNAAEVPDMSTFDPQSDHWVANHFLNSVLRGGFEFPLSAYIHNYLRRAEGAFTEHAEARRHTLSFIDLKGQAPGVYARALSHWEFFLTHSWQSEALLGKLLETSTTHSYSIFVQGDGSIKERLNHLYNSMKHAESRIASGQILEGALVPVWLTNLGLQSTDTLLTFAETGEILEEIAYWADIFVDPIDARNKLRREGESS